MSTCKNCDAPTSRTYCSQTCEDMDRHPAPRDDMDTMTSTTWDTDETERWLDNDPYLYTTSRHIVRYSAFPASDLYHLVDEYAQITEPLSVVLSEVDWEYIVATIESEDQ